MFKEEYFFKSLFICFFCVRLPIFLLQHWQCPAGCEEKGGVWTISQYGLSYPHLYQITTQPNETFYCLAKTTKLYDNIRVNLKKYWDALQTHSSSPYLGRNLPCSEVGNTETQDTRLVLSNSCRGFRKCSYQSAKMLFPPSNCNFLTNIFSLYFLS